MSQRVRRLSTALGAVSVVVAGVVVAAPVAPAATAPLVGSVTVFLRAPHPHALSQLAAAHGLSHDQRVARLARLVPTDAAVRTVTTTLARDGLAVGSQTAWSITATAPQSVIASVFGTRLAGVVKPTLAQLQAETGTLPIIPRALAGVVSAVFPTTGGPAVLKANAERAVTGGAIRDAYAKAGVKPPGASKTADGAATIATVQLANLPSSDLATYARKTGLPDIVGTSRYHPVTVHGGPSKADDASGGGVEAALDQEAILATAPSATQRPYFAPNTNAGFADVFANVFDDVTQNRHENGHGDPHIVALSTSWGGCEPRYGAAAIKTLQTQIKAVVAAGVTVFASSGDDGIYDCRDSSGTGLGNSKSTVDYPASSPEVVGVGGTNLQPTGKTPARNNGHNWREKAWSCTNTITCEGSGGLPILPRGTGGSGGGESGTSSTLLSTSPFTGFAEPSYQKKAMHGVFAHQAHRLVPDIAAVGDPETGFDIYSSDPSVKGSENSKGFVAVGGTSLSSPVSAALFTNALAAAGKHTGIGDILPALYLAYRKHVHGFRDVTVGGNGSAANRGRDPSVIAHVGYDTVSGLGGVIWPALTKYLLRH